MPGRRQEVGRLGEAAAVRALTAAGYAVVCRNYRCRAGEIDIVARDGDDLVFVEVKSRRTSTYGVPAEAVGWRKKMKLIRTAAHYLAGSAPPDVNCRFDVVAVTLGAGGAPQVEIIRNAFLVEGGFSF